MKLQDVSQKQWDEFKELAKSWVCFSDCVGYEDRPETLTQVAKELWNTSCINQIRGDRFERMENAVRGLPSYLNNPFSDFDIHNTMNALGFEEWKDGNLELYWNMLGCVLVQELEKDF